MKSQFIDNTPLIIPCEFETINNIKYLKIQTPGVAEPVYISRQQILEFLGIQENDPEEQVNEDDVSKIVISIKSGVIQNITTNKDPNCLIVVADYDTESAEENNGVIHEDINADSYTSGYYAIPELYEEYVNDIFESLMDEVISDIKDSSSKQAKLSIRHLDPLIYPQDTATGLLKLTLLATKHLCSDDFETTKGLIYEEKN